MNKKAITTILVSGKKRLDLFAFQYIVKPFIHAKPKYKKKYSVSICAIFKDEGLYIKEWLEYHLMLGIEHFYLYDNGSTDKVIDIIDPYITSGQVTLIPFPGSKMQMNAYRDFFQNYSNETQWVSFIDIDEYICPNETYDILSWIRKNDYYPILLVYWKMFGTSALTEHDFNKLLIEQYHVCWKRLYHVGKCFFNTDYQLANPEVSFHHEPRFYYSFFGFKLKCPPINQNGRIALQEDYLGLQKWEDYPRIQINHYWSKAWNIYDAKRNRPSACRGELKTRLSYFLWHEHQNCSIDYNIYKYVMQLKLRMSNIE